MQLRPGLCLGLTQPVGLTLLSVFCVCLSVLSDGGAVALKINNKNKVTIQPLKKERMILLYKNTDTFHP